MKEIGCTSKLHALLNVASEYLVKADGVEEAVRLRSLAWVGSSAPQLQEVIIGSTSRFLLAVVLVLVEE